MATIEKAISLAALAHEGQLDKIGEKYILHPIRVMNNIKISKETKDYSELLNKCRIVAILHDVVEDTEITDDDLIKQGFSEDVIYALQLLTHDKSVPYMEYVKKVNEDVIAKTVKAADLLDNTNPERVMGVMEIKPEKMMSMLENKYYPALVYLQRDCDPAMKQDMQERSSFIGELISINAEI